MLNSVHLRKTHSCHLKIVKIYLTSSDKNKKVTCPKKTWHCVHCPATFLRSWTLKFHLRTVHKTQDYNLSPKMNFKETVSEKHSHPDEISLMCGRCAYPAKNADDLVKYIMTTAP